MRVLELNHVALHVRDLEAACHFYRDILRLEAMPRPAFTFPGAWFRLGGQQELHLIGERATPVVSHRRGNHFALCVDNLDEWQTHLSQAKADFVPPKSRPDGALQLFLTDPDGHVVELFTGP